MKRTVCTASAVLVALLALTACVPGANGGAPTGTPSPRPTSKTTPSATASPSATPSATPSPSSAPSETPLSASGAYDRCVALASELVYPGRPLTAAAFASADVIPRSDGLWYVYTEATVDDVSDPAQRDIALECVLGGTVEQPNDQIFGAVVRSPLSSRSPDAPLPQG